MQPPFIPPSPQAASNHNDLNFILTPYTRENTQDLYFCVRLILPNNKSSYFNDYATNGQASTFSIAEHYPTANAITNF